MINVLAKATSAHRVSLFNVAANSSSILARKFSWNRHFASTSTSTSSSTSSSSTSNSTSQKPTIDIDEADHSQVTPLTVTEKLSQAWIAVKPKVVTTSLLAAAGIVGVVGLSSVWDISMYFASLNFAHVGAVAYVCGFISAGMMTASYFFMRSKLVLMRPDRLLSQVQRRIRNDTTVQKLFGPDVTSGNLQAFAYAHESQILVDRIKKVTGSKNNHQSTTNQSNSSVGVIGRINDYLHSHKILQVLFEVRGLLGQGYCAAEICLDGGRLKYNSLTVTKLDTNEVILLEGENRPVFQAVFGNQAMLESILRNTLEEHEKSDAVANKTTL